MPTNPNGHWNYNRPRDYRHTCGRLLFRGVLPPGSHLSLRCPKCGRAMVYDVPVTSTGVMDWFDAVNVTTLQVVAEPT